MFDIQPLETTVFDKVTKNQSWAERAWRFIPILGWFISDDLWKRRHKPVHAEINRILEGRPFLEMSIWGDNCHQEIALFVCSAINELIGWPNNRYIPADNVGVLMWSIYDGLEAVEIFMDIEERFGIKLSDEECESICKQNMAAFVELIATRSSKPVAAQE